VCDPLDLDGMARLMGVLSSDAVDVNEMGEASRQIVAQYTPETWAQTLADCIERTLACKQENLGKGAFSLSPGFQFQKQGAGSQIRE
jgi:hypothetical protein